VIPFRQAAGLLVLGALSVACTTTPTAAAHGDPLLSAPPRASSAAPEASPPAPVDDAELAPTSSVEAFVLDSSQLVVATSHGSGRARLELLGADGSRRALGTTGLDLESAGPVLAWRERSVWYLVTSHCASTGLELYRSTDQGRTWEDWGGIGPLGCHAGDRARVLSALHHGVLVTSSAVGEATWIGTRGRDGRWHPAQRTQKLYGPGAVAVASDGSYVRVEGFDEFPDQVLWRARSLGAHEERVHLPGGETPLAATLATTGDGYVVLSARGTPYTSVDGRRWVARAVPLRCDCERRQLQVLDGLTWFAAAQQGTVVRLARTTDGGRSWSVVSGPPAVQGTLGELVVWNETSVVVERYGSSWLTTDLGTHWRRL
jgi:hypothetical protein